MTSLSVSIEQREQAAKLVQGKWAVITGGWGEEDEPWSPKAHTLFWKPGVHSGIQSLNSTGVGMPSGHPSINMHPPFSPHLYLTVPYSVDSGELASVYRVLSGGALARTNWRDIPDVPFYAGRAPNTARLRLFPRTAGAEVLTT